MTKHILRAGHLPDSWVREHVWAPPTQEGRAGPYPRQRPPVLARGLNSFFDSQFSSNITGGGNPLTHCLSHCTLASASIWVCWTGPSQMALQQWTERREEGGRKHGTGRRSTGRWKCQNTRNFLTDYWLLLNLSIEKPEEWLSWEKFVARFCTYLLRLTPLSQKEMESYEAMKSLQFQGKINLPFVIISIMYIIWSQRHSVNGSKGKNEVKGKVTK